MANYTAPAAKTTNGQLLHTEWNSLTAEAQELSEAMPTKAPAASPTFTGTVTVPDGSFTVGKTTGLQAALDGKAPTTRTITAGTGLTGGGDLTANRTLAVSYGTTAGTAAQGNDTRLSDARTPTSHAASHASGGADALAISGAQVTSGTIPPARLGGGTASDSTVLHGDGTWKTAPTGGGTVTFDGLPAGSVIFSTTTTRPSARTDLMCIFTGADPGSNALAGDQWIGS